MRASHESASLCSIASSAPPARRHNFTIIASIHGKEEQSALLSPIMGVEQLGMGFRVSQDGALRLLDLSQPFHLSG
jgi:hypothetical protein